MPKRAPSSLHQALAHPLTDKRLEILRAVGESGSISAAARRCSVSYKAAWQAIDTLSNLAATALVEKAVGGSGGGGARLTPAGEQLLQAAERLDQARAAALAPAASRAAALPSGLALRTSMRNQLPCTLQRLAPERGALRASVVLADGSQQLHARITRESAQLLGLTPGQPLLALCKATAVEMTASESDGAENCLRGEVQRASRARDGGEVALKLPGGEVIVGFCGPDSGLRLRGEAWALLPASAVVLALPD